MSSSSSSSTLPPDMVFDILSRLPVKSLLRFRSASKPLCSMIDGPDFAKLHLHRTSFSNQSLILANNHCPMSCINLSSLERAVKVTDYPLKNRRCEVVVVGSCHGLLCLVSNDKAEVVALWNKSTGKHHIVPETPVLFPNTSSEADGRSYSLAYGLGYDSVSDDYKLVRIVRFHGSEESEVRVYSLKWNSWKNKVGCFHYDLLYNRSGGELVGRAVHWLTRHPKEKGGSVIVAFDMSTEEFLEVPLPPDAPYTEIFMFLQLASLEDRLCLTHHNLWGKKTDIWILKEGWEKLISTSNPLINGSAKCMFPVSYLSNGNGVLLLKNYEKFVRYDLDRNMVKKVRVKGLPPSFDVTPYVHSLVSPLPMVETTVSGDDASVGMHKGRGGRRGKNNAGKRVEFLSTGFKLSKGLKLSKRFKPTVSGDGASVGKHKGRRGKNNVGKRDEFLSKGFKLSKGLKLSKGFKLSKGLKLSKGFNRTVRGDDASVGTGQRGRRFIDSVAMTMRDGAFTIEFRLAL